MKEKWEGIPLNDETDPTGRLRPAIYSLFQERERNREALLDIAREVRGVSATDHEAPHALGFVQGRIPSEILRDLNSEQGK